MKTALSIAGLDPSGGAGVLADVRVFSAFGVYGMAVVSALTAQNSRGVSLTSPLNPNMVVRQLDSLFSDFDISAVKIGMLGTRQMVSAIGKFLSDSGFGGPVVLDPIIRSSSGALLLDPQALRALKRELLPHITLIKPNLHEASMLSETPVETVVDMREAAGVIAGMGAGAVLITGGHLKTRATDVLLDDRGFAEFTSKRLPKEVHGTGCHLSAAITAGLARGVPVRDAVAEAKKYLDRLLEKGTFKPGSGVEYFTDCR
jgi:hydroxymethylpyrimidine/phosphomethylpyrimidine kinase